jgi:RNA polymerase sigma-70 factor, ECF subfamily
VDLSFDQVYRDEFPFVWRCLRGLGLRKPALDDAAQDVFLVVHRRLPSFRADSSLRTWLYGIVRNVAGNHRRRHQRKGQNEPLPEQAASTIPGPAERAQEAEAAAFMQRFLDGLEPDRREVFLLVVLEELSVPEAAAALGIPLNTAYTRLRLARAELVRVLNREHQR